MTQKEQIREHLKANGSITSKVAWEMYSITRLAPIIQRLKKDGFEIISIPKRDKRFNWALYRLTRIPKKHTKVQTEFEIELGKV